MDSDEFSETVSSNDEGAASERPGCVTTYAILLLMGGVLGLVLPFLYAFGPSGSMFTTQHLTVASIRSVVHAAVSIMTAVGLWRLQRWGAGLVVALAAYGLGSGVYSIRNAATNYGGGAALYAVLPLMVSLVVVYWFVRNRALFKPTPSFDRWIVSAGALALAVIFVMELVWV